MYHLHGPSLQDMDFFLAPTQSFPFHWRGGLVQVRVRTLTPLPQVTLQAENALQSEKPPSTAVKQDREHECVTEDHAPCSIKPGRPYRDNRHQFTFSRSFTARDFVRTTDFNYILKRVLFIPHKKTIFLRNIYRQNVFSSLFAGYFFAFAQESLANFLHLVKCPVVFLCLHTNLLKNTFPKTFWPQKKVSNLVGRTGVNGPQNWSKAERILTKRCNKLQ